MPLIFWARIVGRASRRFHRCTYLDWRDAFWERLDPGELEGVLRRRRSRASARRRPRASGPTGRGAQIRTHHGYFDAASGLGGNQAVIEAINAYRPDIVLVGMGMPRQDIWVLENQAKLGPCVTFTVGGAFDYEAGVQRPRPAGWARSAWNGCSG